MVSDWINGEWATEEYQKNKLENFKCLVNYLKTPPRNLLDIGCGFAWESRYIYKKYNTELWLLDGDIADNNKKSVLAKETKYNTSSEDFLFYNSLSRIDQELKNDNIKNYRLVNYNDMNIPQDIKFDLITSWLSCGFHYPVSTYKELILNHSHNNTRIIMDLRCHLKTKEIIKEQGIEIVGIVRQNKKNITAEIKFNG